jgi:hypothetical protein
MNIIVHFMNTIPRKRIFWDQDCTPGLFSANPIKTVQTIYKTREAVNFGNRNGLKPFTWVIAGRLSGAQD